MVFTIVNSIEFPFRKYKKNPMKMAIWHITTHFVVEGHKMSMSISPGLHSDRVSPVLAALHIT